MGFCTLTILVYFQIGSKHADADTLSRYSFDETDTGEAIKIEDEVVKAISSSMT